MGLVIDVDSAEEMLFDLNRDNTNKSIYAKQFGINSLNQQKAQSSVDQAYSESLMNSYQTFLQQQNQSNALGMIDGLRDEVNKYNYDSLEKAYQNSMAERLNATYDIYSSYLEAQGKVGEELTGLAEAYGKRADSYLEYMKQAQLDSTIEDYLIKTGIITEPADIEGGVPATFADDSVIRNKMFANETIYDDNGNVVVRKGELTNEGRAIMNMLQSNYSKQDADEKSELSYDAWIDSNDKYKDDKIDKAVMRQMLGIESEYGKQYSKREMMALSSDYRNAVANAESAKLDGVKLENNTAYQSIISGNDVRIKSSDIDTIEKDFDNTIDTIRKSLEEYGFTEEEFNDFLKSEGLNYTLQDASDASLSRMRENVVTEGEEGKETGLWIDYGVAVAEETAAGALAAYHTAAAAASYGAALFTLGTTAAVGAYHTGMAIAATATMVAAGLLADSIHDDATAYGKQLDQKVRQMINPAKELGIYYSTIKQKFNKFMKESK